MRFIYFSTAKYMKVYIFVKPTVMNNVGHNFIGGATTVSPNISATEKHRVYDDQVGGTNIVTGTPTTMWTMTISIAATNMKVVTTMICLSAVKGLLYRLVTTFCRFHGGTFLFLTLMEIHVLEQDKAQ